MRQHPRKTNPGVRDGVVQKKNRTDPSPGYRNWIQEMPEIDRQRPGPGHRHLLRKSDVARFVRLIPNWAELSRGLDAIVLAPGSERADGTYSGDVIRIHAWTRELGRPAPRGFAEGHARLLARLNVAVRELDRESVWIEWTEAAARGYQLLHVFLHELGHHADRMSTRSQRESSRGESWAEEFAVRRADGLWEPYVKTFGDF